MRCSVSNALSFCCHGRSSDQSNSCYGEWNTKCSIFFPLQSDSIHTAHTLCSLKINEIIRNHKVFMYYIANYTLYTNQNHHRKIAWEPQKALFRHSVYSVWIQFDWLLFFARCTIFLTIWEKRHIHTVFFRKRYVASGHVKCMLSHRVDTIYWLIALKPDFRMHFPTTKTTRKKSANFQISNSAEQQQQCKHNERRMGEREKEREKWIMI